MQIAVKGFHFYFIIKVITQVLTNYVSKSKIVFTFETLKLKTKLSAMPKALRFSSFLNLNAVRQAPSFFSREKKTKRLA